MSFAAVGTARFAIAQLVLQNHREHDMVPYGREHFVVWHREVQLFDGISPRRRCFLSQKAQKGASKICAGRGCFAVLARG